jgi:mono/diheme cytochrome c family protein
MRRCRRATGCPMLALVLAACTAKEPSVPADPLVERGRSVYVQQCTACHSPDPAQTGAVGPAVKGSSRELLEARILRAEYPAGYTPKRTTTTMVALPQLAGDIDALAAFLK